MSIESAPYYWLECNHCGAKSTEASEFSAWAEPASARAEADDSGWTAIGSGDYCPGCWHLDDADNEVINPAPIKEATP